MRHGQLKAFHHVAIAGGFSRAAEVLNLTQPAVSEQVRNLEQDHDLLLFRREKKRVRLTEAGERLLLMTKQYFEIEGQIEDYLSESSAVIEGELRIIADSTHHLTEFLGPFNKRHPSVAVSIRTGNTEEILTELRSYNAEIGVVGSVTPGKDMAMVNLGASEIVAFARKGVFAEAKTALTIEDLADLPLVFREAGSKTRQKLEDAAQEQGVTLSPAIVAEGRESVRELVASGAGIGFVSEAEFGHDARLVRIGLKGASLQMPEAMVYLSQRRDVKVIRAFMEFVEKTLADRETTPDR